MQAKIEYTTRCNLNCLHCSAAMFRPAPDWEPDALMDLLNQLIADGYNEFHLQGGEPLIRSDLFDVLNLFEQNNASFVISTNSLLLDEEKLDRLLQYKGLIMLTFSLDGATAKTHNTIRGEDAFDYVLKMIQHAVKKRPVLHARTSIGLNHTLTKINYHELNDVFKLANTLGIDSVSVLSLSLRGNAAKNKDKLLLSKKDEFIALQNAALVLRKINMNRKIKRVPPLIFNVELYPYTWKCILMNQSRHLVSYVRQHICSSGIHTIYIAADGTIYPCEAARPLLGALETLLGPYERPNIKDYTIAEAKETESFKNIVNYLQDYDHLFSSITPCNTCGHLGKCTICPLVVLADGEAKQCTEEVLSHVL